MTRYMAQYRYIGESHSDNSFSTTKTVDFLKDITECERNDCEMLILLLMKEFACMKHSQIILMSSHFQISQISVGKKKIRSVVPSHFQACASVYGSSSHFKMLLKRNRCQQCHFSKGPTTITMFLQFPESRKAQLHTGKENIQREIHPQQNHTDPVESTA